MGDREVARSAPAFDVVAVVAAGGVLGTLARYAVGVRWPVAAGAFPWTTFAVNTSGSLALGAVAGLTTERMRPGRYLRPFLGTGVLGAFTTFSTFVVEADQLVRGGAAGLAAGYVAASLVVGITASVAGLHLVRPRRRGRHRRERA